MILHKDIKQRTEDWFKIKHGKIGGSTSKGLLIKTDTLLLEMLAARCEDFEHQTESFESADMQRGNELEPIAIRELQTYTGVKFEEIGWIEHETIKILGISPDGLNESCEIGCEVKCPSSKVHVEWIRADIVPLKHIDQCIHAFTVIDTLETFHFASFRPENKLKPLFVKTLTRQSEVNIGTKAKPVLKTIEEVVEMKEQAAKQMEIDLLTELENIKF